ncbi:hypothetical protein J14TS2_34790 [Bacillus sp. J14TS2]|uniref:DUF6440 family protein n=1 Tax=Bacillus sp. J14TS2 TaxID=2807188 RepID=UPI001B2C99FE|nr:DUF6440 family protein [Bacillus sp. J14TS2]GIN73004.1 hypothetical protein J14TS2_34790 [Bacillus sp. J14TS2]
MADNEKRFEEVYTQGKLKVTKVIRDNETGVLYMLHQEGYGAGLTVMLDQEGKPLVDKDFKK